LTRTFNPGYAIARTRTTTLSRVFRLWYKVTEGRSSIISTPTVFGYSGFWLQQAQVLPSLLPDKTKTKTHRLMSTGFGVTNPFAPTSQFSKSPGSSLGNSLSSLNDDNFQVSTDDVDQLLSALEASTNDQDFLKSNDDSFVQEMLGSENVAGMQNLSLMRAEAHELGLTLAGHHSFNSLGGIEPLGLFELSSESNLLTAGAVSYDLKSSSQKLNDIVNKFDSSDANMDENGIESTNPVNPFSLPGFNSEEPSGEATSSAGGKRRRVPRRGSLPTMHLHYEDPYEPTPIIEHKTMFEQQQHEEEPPPKLAAVPADDAMPSDIPRGGFRRAQRRGSLPTMHLNYESSSFATTSSHNNDESYSRGNGAYEDVFEEMEYGTDGFMQTENREATPRRVGRMQRRGSTGSFYAGSTSASYNSHAGLGVGDVSATVPENLDPEKMMKRLQELMEQSYSTQSQLQQWDKANGLPKSHSQTMVNTSRSRKQLLDGVILPKWDGTPLISEDVELGKPKPRSKVHKKDSGGKMKRRMSAPTSSAFF
jgi:hypothetical protein